MSMTAVEPPVAVVPARRRRLSSSEIIDVDSLNDEDLGLAPGPSQRRRTRAPAGEPEHIILSDSDDEIRILGARPLRPPPIGRARSFRIFSPPPPPLNMHIPPVPPLPRHLAADSSPPMRRHHHHHDPRSHAHGYAYTREHAPIHTHAGPQPPSGVIRPNEQPFAWEPRPLQRRLPVAGGSAAPGAGPALMAAPPSHHLPAMGFGGALLAYNRHHLQDQARTRRDLREVEARSFFRHLHDIPGIIGRGLWGRNWLGAGAPTTREQEEADLLDALALSAALHEGRDDGEGRQPSFGQTGNLLRRSRAEPEWRKSYTHPPKPAPGFTFDFDPSSNAAPSIDLSGPSTSKSSSQDESGTILVCALCLDPLVIGGPEENRTKNRLWGLRCGHLLDGKCVEKIMRPPSKMDTEAVLEDSVQSRDKGKGKAKADPDPAPQMQSPAPLDFPTPEPFVDSIRSRLRPRSNIPATGPSTSSLQQSPSGLASTSMERPVRPLPTRARARGKASRGRGKGKGKTRAPVVEAEHEWTCPVSGCERVHVSLLIEGMWVMDGERGAIAVYA